MICFRRVIAATRAPAIIVLLICAVTACSPAPKNVPQVTNPCDVDQVEYWQTHAPANQNDLEREISELLNGDRDCPITPEKIRKVLIDMSRMGRR